MPYKPPVDSPWRSTSGPSGYLELLKRIKRMLDPNDIMNPASWASEGGIGNALEYTILKGPGTLFLALHGLRHLQDLL